MTEQKLVIVVMGQNCEKFIPMCLNSVIEADAIVYCDGESSDDTLSIVHSPAVDIIKNSYNQEDPQMNGKQRNFYLDYVKKNYPNDWCLVLDADEVLDTDGIKKIKEFLSSQTERVFDVHMRHLHENLGREDATVDRHYVLHRLFKITNDLIYPEVEHPVLQGTFTTKGKCEVTVFHLAHIDHCFSIKKRYEKQIKHSNIHTPEFLDSWKDSHMLGVFPNKQVNILEVPDVITNYFHINKDKYYFISRGIELKHPIQVKQWYDYFKPDSVLDLGCGRGVYLYFWRWFVERSWGIELSNWAVNHQFIDGILEADICDESKYKNTDLITAIDVLEHLTDEQLDKTLKNMSKFGKKFLFSIPFIGDPNLDNDKTHIQKKTKEDWIELIESYGIKLEEVPLHFLFREQILIGRKKYLNITNT